MIFQFHHVASDGLGAFGFVRDVIKVLNNPELPEELRDTSRVVERYDLGYGRDSVFQMARRQMRALRASVALSAKAVPLIPHEIDCNTVRNPLVSHTTKTLSSRETSALKVAAQNAGVSVNTLLLRDTFVALDRFRRDHGICQKDGWLRIAVPGSRRAISGCLQETTSV